MASRKGTRSTKKSRRGATPRVARIRAGRRAIGTNINYQYWIVGFQSRHAQQTGVVLTEAQVRRNADFKRAVDDLLGADPKKFRIGAKNKYAYNSPVARALVTLGVRDPAFRGHVGNSP